MAVHKLHSQTMLTRFWVFLTTYPPALTISMVWTLTNSGHFWTTYLPRLVNVVCERPLRTFFCEIYILSRNRYFFRLSFEVVSPRKVLKKYTKKQRGLSDIPSYLVLLPLPLYYLTEGGRHISTNNTVFWIKIKKIGELTRQ